MSQFHRTADGAIPFRSWADNLESDCLKQMRNACSLPVTVAAALMPDAHVGYGVPIGGVVACENAVIPYAVGVDIACRVKLTLLDIPPKDLNNTGEVRFFIDTIERETRFGIGAEFKNPRQHEVLDRDWTVSPVTHAHKRKAEGQLGTSGSGNHFVELGTVDLPQADPGLEAGTYVALLSHSGSRGSGAAVCNHYSRLASRLHPELPRELQQLAWLDLDTEAGQEYWAAMSLMGEYASANHAVIHREMVRALKCSALASIENHHNFAWKERHNGRDLIVHRKGATPAGAGVLGFIPGSMATPGFIVRGKGNAQSLESAAHGAGRRMSRTAAKRNLNWEDARRFLKERRVTLISASLDEVPSVYKNIDEVMAAQGDLVEVVGRFEPRIVKMAPDGEKAED